MPGLDLLRARRIREHIEPFQHRAESQRDY
jgi:hypothetical protein